MSLRVFCSACGGVSVDPRDCLRAGCPYDFDDEPDPEMRAYRATTALMREGYSPEDAAAIVNGDERPSVAPEVLAWVAYAAIWTAMVAVAVIAYIWWPPHHAP